MISGAGTTEVTGAIGGNKALGTLTLQQNAAGSTGTVTFDSAVFAQSLATFARSYAIAFDGGGTINSAVTFSNTGGLTLGNDAGDVLLFNGSLSGGSNAVNAAGTIETAGAAITLAATTLTAATTIDATDGGSSAAGGNIHFTSTINGGSALALNAGTTGAITLDSAIGGTTRLGAITIAKSAGVTAGGNITAASLTQTAGTGTSDFKGTINTNTATGVNVTGASTVSFESAVTATSGGGATISNSGTLTMTSMTLAGAFAQSGGGRVSAAGTLVTSSASVTFTNRRHAGRGICSDRYDQQRWHDRQRANIHFASTIDGGSALSLKRRHGRNDRARMAALGSSTRLGAVTITKSGRRYSRKQHRGRRGSTQVAGTGTSDFKGTINTNTATGVSITGAAVTFEQSVTATSSGGATISNSGTLTMTNMTLAGAFIAIGRGRRLGSRHTGHVRRERYFPQMRSR